MKKRFFLFFIVFLVGICAFKANSFICFAKFAPNEKITETEIEKFDFYKYTGNIEHFFTHQIINRPDIAFNSQNKYRYNFYRDCVTYKEFARFLDEMYKNDYILVDIYDCYDVDGEKIGKKELYLPKGKKPFLLSFDDMSFDTKNKGMSDKLILDENGQIASFTSSNETQVEYDKEAIPLLENFIKQHPDFSFNNARGVICPTGYNGILGYRINSENPNCEKQLEKIKPLVEKLKSLNYHFASHTFNHIMVSEISCENLKKDTKRYTEDILSVIGNTNIYCFPCGKYTLNEEKLKILNDAGYKIFFCVGLNKDHFVHGKNLFLSRKVLDGLSLKRYHDNYLPIIDTYKIYDFAERA